MQNMEEIYREYAQIIYKYIFCLTKNEDLSEEIMQETFVIAVKEINKFRGDCKISVWLCQIAKHLWFKQIKKEKQKKEIYWEDLTSEVLIENEELEEILCKKEERIDLFKRIQKLEEPAKSVMYLKISGDLSFKEIGEILNQSANWARVVFYRGKEKLKEGKNGKKERM